MKVVTDIRFTPDWPYIIVTITKKEILLDKDGEFIGLGEPEYEEVSVGPQ